MSTNNASSQPDRLSDTDFLIGGRWSSEGEDCSEQLEAANLISQYLDFDNNYEYSHEEFNSPPTGLTVATIF